MGNIEVRTVSCIFTPVRKYNPIDVVLDFIVQNYPVSEYPRILEIAAGSGNFSSKLADLSYQVTAMDPRTRYNPNLSYDVITEPFYQYTDISDYDLGIAIHPCGIHKDIIQNFKLNEKALFLIPCYILTCDNRELTSYKNEDAWLEHLEAFNPKMKRKKFFASENTEHDFLLASYQNAFYTKK